MSPKFFAYYNLIIFSAAGGTASAFLGLPPSSKTTTARANSYLDDLQGNNGAFGAAAAAEQQGDLQGGGRSGLNNNNNNMPLYEKGPQELNDWIAQESTLIQGNSLRTWAVPDMETHRVLLTLRTEGRPMTSTIELWQGPDYTPTKMKVYVEDVMLRPFQAIVETPMSSNTIAVYNTANMEFPFYANLEEYSDRSNHGLALAPMQLAETAIPHIVQGGSITSFPFPPEVDSIHFLLKTDGRNLKARVELMQGPNNDKQIMEFYSSDGYKRPFYAVVETPGSGNVVRIINENTMEFPFFCSIAPFVISNLMQGGQGDFVID